jgi:hypothetical protein
MAPVGKPFVSKRTGAAARFALRSFATLDVERVANVIEEAAATPVT